MTYHKKRILGFDIIRSLAVMLVLISHASFFIYGNFKTEPLLSTLLNYNGDVMMNKGYGKLIVFFLSCIIVPLFHSIDVGLFGVCLFFLLSGYLFAQQSYTQSAGKIYVRRILRIYIPIIAIYVIGINLSLFLLNRSFLPKKPFLSIFGLNVPDVGILWTICCELFYFFDISSK